MQMIKKTFSYRLEPTSIQRQKIEQFAGSARFIFNYGLAQIKTAFDQKKKIPTYVDIAKQLPQLKKMPEMEWLKDVHSQALQHSLKDLESGLKHFWRRIKNKQGKAGFPHFKKKGFKDSFRYPQGVSCSGGKIYLPKIGLITYRDSRPIEGKINQTTIKRDGDHWFVHIACEFEQAVVQAPITEEKTIGIDLGLLKLAHLSNDQVIENPKHLKRNLAKLQKLSKKFSRTKKMSSNRKKSAKKLGKLHTKIKNQRKDFLHKITTDLVKNQDVIAVENLTVNGMVRNRRLSRSISDAGWAIFINMLTYKCSWHGKHLIKVNKFLPSSKECSSCHAIQDMPLSIRRYLCQTCGINLDRDLNASKNIRAAGLSALNAYGGNGVGLPHDVRIIGLKADECQ